MLIEIRGVGFVNKGAELMLLAILSRLRKDLPDALFALEPTASDDYPVRAKLGLYQKVWLHKCGLQWGRWGGLIPKKLRQRYGLVIDKEVNVVLDASGFSYSEQWGKRSSLLMASYLNTWKRRGVKVVLLPQAMGPFISRPVRRAFASIVAGADLVFPRDTVSMKHVIDLVGERGNVHQAPDFTCLLQGTLPAELGRFQSRFCLVPSYRMIDETKPRESELYRSLFVECIRHLVQIQQKPFILIHEGQRDLSLARQIVQESRTHVEIITESDALKVKGILGLCSGVISSRFHAIVSALSQGVPVLATGWSHKYEMLFQEYRMPEACLPVSVGHDTLRERISSLLDGTSRVQIVARISEAAAVQRERAAAMWERVLGVVRQ
jgi:polysaccharide pyruvyl transferase WcaK-like protein